MALLIIPIHIRVASQDRAALDDHPRLGRARGQRTVVVRHQTPPVGPPDIPGLQGQEQKHPHESNPCIERRRQHVRIARPPLLVHPIHVNVEEDASGPPHDVVDCPHRWHAGRGAHDERHVYELDPFLVRVLAPEEVHRDWAQEANQEPPVQGGVHTLAREHAEGTNHPPYDGRVVEDFVPRARPRAAFGQKGRVADVLHGREEPPRCAEVHARCNYGNIYVNVWNKCMCAFADLHDEHGLGRDLHVVTQFEITHEPKCLYHAYVSVRLESNICKGPSRVNVTYDHLSYDV
ncbi:(Rice Genome Annotation Project) RNA recognitionmotif family protein [Striga asiatica]|uniref:(Rice Genome Annotation Project) RNA recognitionmotif family protein n=1 Tax=Striga asiatica TaxID=4170 RepID=A0A5A7QLS4_STRAF|nr:(Rice Genome Annotation Project) RNA recognitionmotif family protein [Striga asiatica]